MGIDQDEIAQRLESDLKEQGAYTYYFGIVIALVSAFLDTVGYFLIR